MFNFLKSPCSDADLFGYFVQCVGGTYNLALSIGEDGFSRDNLLRCIDAALQQRRRKIDDRQKSLIQLATKIVVQCVTTGKPPEITQAVQRLAEMKREGDFDFLDSSVVQLRNSMAPLVVFNF